MLEIGRELSRRQVDLADQQGVAGGGPDRLQHLGDLGVVARAHLVDPGEVLGHGQRGRPRGRRVVAQGAVLHRPLDRVEAKAVDPALAPEPDHPRERLADLGVAPVEVRLLGIERVQVPAPGVRVAAPRRPAEGGEPVVRRPVAVGPHVPVGVLAKPGVLDRGVRDDQVGEQADSPAVALLDQVVEVLERAVDGVDRRVVADVVAAVRAGRGVDGREPHGVDAEPLEVVEARGDPGQVADAVAVGILERPGVDLVDDRGAPPGRG